MKRLYTLIVLSILFYNWIGYQFYTAITDENANQTLIDEADQRDLSESSLNTTKTPTCRFSFFVKDIDSDDLLEFTSSENYSANEIFLTFSNDILPDHANKENHRTSFKCFNGEYYSRLDKLFTKYPDAYSSGKVPDRYLLKIPVIFLNPKDHPPQHVG